MSIKKVGSFFEKLGKKEKKGTAVGFIFHSTAQEKIFQIFPEQEER